MATRIYLVSDLHFGGDGDMAHCDYTPEFVAFLRQLEQEAQQPGAPHIELILVGDTFGFWELTVVEGDQKLRHIIGTHQEIFEQFRHTGQHVTITCMVGNHDYDLAYESVYVAQLAEYNIRLETEQNILREVGGKKIWIEHGQQRDLHNACPDYGNQYALPVGYFITNIIVSGASRHSSFGSGNWLKDIRSCSTVAIPEWLKSNYFYREMHGLLRWLLLPFLLLSGLTMFGLIAEGLRLAGVYDYNVLFHNKLVNKIPLSSQLLQIVVGINMLVTVVVGIPLWFVLRDIMKTLRRKEIYLGPESLETIKGDGPYITGAKQVFADHPDVDVFVYGHTHGAFLKRLESPDSARGKIVLNTGTWIKLLDRVPARIGFVPAVFCPSFRLNHFCITDETGKATIRYTQVPKTTQQELTILQRMLLCGRRPTKPEAIAAETVV